MYSLSLDPFYHRLQLYDVYLAVDSGKCTDDFTTSILTGRLHPVPIAFGLALTMIVVIILMFVVSSV